MAGNLTMGTAHTSDPANHTNSFIVYDGTHKMGIDASGDGLEGKAGFDASTGRLNVFTGHVDNVIALRAGEVDRVLITKRGAEVAAGHAVYVEGQNIDERYASELTRPQAGTRVTEELEVEGSLHIHGDGDVDTPKLKIKDQDSDERYLLRIEYVPPVGSVSSATVGDVKSAFLTADHGGWVLLDGRAITGLTATQQTAAIGLGFATNLPNAAGVVLMQGGALGAVTGSMSRTLTPAQMPRHFHQAACITNDQGKRGIYDMLNGGGDLSYPATVWYGSAEIVCVNNQNGVDHVPVYGRMMEDAGNDEPLDITPKSLSVNQFVYLKS